jgi:predicted PurR-regulated permease PerM
MVLGTLGNWLVAGVGGLLGALGGGALCFAALFYMLQGRDSWLESLTLAARRLGMNPRDDLLAQVREEVVTFLGYLALVASCYAVIVSLALWLIGVPQPLLWGLIAGLFEVVPYFGPLIASVLPTIVALSLGTWWQPLAVAGLFLTLHLVEGYFISPMVYGRAVKLDPVTILFGAVFFGWLWGPAGLAVSTPMLLLLRGLLEITTDTPALDALADIDGAKTKNGAGARQATHTS